MQSDIVKIKYLKVYITWTKVSLGLS